MDRIVDEDSEMPGSPDASEHKEVRFLSTLSDRLERFAREEVTPEHLEYYAYFDCACCMRLLPIECMMSYVLRWLGFHRPDLCSEVTELYQALTTSAKEHDQSIRELRNARFNPAIANPYAVKRHAVDLARTLRHIAALFTAAMASREADLQRAGKERTRQGKSRETAGAGPIAKGKPRRNGRKKTPPQVLKETRERQAAKELAKNPDITARALGKVLGCDAATVVRLQAWKKRGVLHRTPAATTERKADGRTRCRR